MNDIERAIEDLKDLSERSSISSTLFKERHGKNFNLAISALEKQIPKKPVIFFNEEILYCPSCTENVNKDDWYCSQCGQKIDWEVENE